MKNIPKLFFSVKKFALFHSYLAAKLNEETENKEVEKKRLLYSICICQTPKKKNKSRI